VHCPLLFKIGIEIRKKQISKNREIPATSFTSVEMFHTRPAAAGLFWKIAPKRIMLDQNDGQIAIDGLTSLQIGGLRVPCSRRRVEGGSWTELPSGQLRRPVHHDSKLPMMRMMMLHSVPSGLKHCCPGLEGECHVARAKAG
jgi:hypothetical protein